MVVMAPADEDECRKMLTTAFRHEGPAAVRYPRGGGSGVAVQKELTTLPIGKADIRRRGRGIALLAFGAMVSPCTRVADALDATLVNMRFVKPLDQALLLELGRTHSAFVTIEDNAIAGGAGSGVVESLAAHGIALPVLQLGLADGFLDHGSREELLAQAGLDAPSIETAIRARFAPFIPASNLRSVS
jgi:1-deoxy-D-xylulose-5-phosphate synthase